MSIVEAAARIADPVVWRKIDEHADKHTNTGASARVARINSLATADKYITAHKAALEAAGYRIVPVGATVEMCEAGWREMPDSISDAYRAMLEAAPKETP